MVLLVKGVFYRGGILYVASRPRFGGYSQARTPQLVWASWRDPAGQEPAVLRVGRVSVVSPSRASRASSMKRQGVASEASQGVASEARQGVTSEATGASPAKQGVHQEYIVL